MRRVTATYAARQLSELLDAVEAQRETFVVERHGRPVATIGPAPASTGRDVKRVLRRHPVDADWAAELHELRSAAVDEDQWNA
jgi:antitoxin (DNA-binding transcriptional repressor) of toxin-antitoxin stability system